MDRENEAREGDLLIGATAIARFLGVTPRQVYHLIYDLEAPAFKMGRSIAARRSTLTNWMDEAEKD